MRQRFVESYSVSGKTAQVIPITKELQEKYSIERTLGSLRESIGPDIATTAPNLYRLPISRMNNKNHNNRIYNSKLWENVCNNQQEEWKGRVGLADHPADSDDGQFKHSAIVWHDMDLDHANNLVWGTGTFVGPYGRLAQEIIDAGGRVGFSSSGFGELMYDGMTVDPDTFQLERCADIVLTPSQDVFGDSSNNIGSTTVTYDSGKAKVIESIEKPQETTNYTSHSDITDNRYKESVMDNAQRPVSKLEEKKFRRDIESFLEDADKLGNPSEKLQELTEILTYFEQGVALDLKEQVEEKINAQREALEEALVHVQETREAFGVQSAAELKAGVALLAEEVKVVEAEAKDWEKIALVLRENNNKLRSTLETALKENKKLSSIKEDAASLKKRVAILQEQRRKTLKNIRENEEANKEDHDKEIDEAMNENRRLKKSLSEKSRDVALLTKELQEARAEARKQKTVIRESKNNSVATSDQVKALRLENNRLKAQLSEASTKIREEANKSKALQEKVQAERKAKAREMARAKRNAMEEQKRPAKPADAMSAYLNFNEAGGAAVESYWSDLVQRHGESILPYERSIRGCKTYREASSAYIRALSAIDASNHAVYGAHLPESTSITREERKQMLESAGMKFGSDKTVTDRMPKGWV